MKDMKTHLTEWVWVSVASTEEEILRLRKMVHQFDSSTSNRIRDFLVFVSTQNYLCFDAS
jgi:hypothetical protein